MKWLRKLRDAYHRWRFDHHNLLGHEYAYYLAGEAASYHFKRAAYHYAKLSGETPHD